MTALLEFKQRLKQIYGTYEIYLLPVLKFILAMGYFFSINQMIGFSDKLKSPFVLLILSLICAILPGNVIVWVGFALMIGNCYSLGIEVAGFVLLLILILLLLFLRFSSKANLLLAFTPLAYLLRIPAVIPMGGGLLSSASAAIPAGCGALFYYLMKLLKEQASVLQSQETELLQKIKLLTDGLMKDQQMWLTVLAFVVVALLVNLIRTRSLDYAWQIAIGVGGVAYTLMMLAGGLFLNVEVDLVMTILSTLAAVILGLALEFFAFGGDYTRTEHLEYEDDEYFYYVKAVPKVSIAASKREIQKINAAPPEGQKKTEEEKTVVEYANPIFEDESWKKQEKTSDGEPTEAAEAAPPVNKPEIDTGDFERKLEESLKDL